MKILEVLDSFYPNFDGPVNVITNIAKILNEKGLAEVDLLVPDYPKNRVEIEGVKIIRTPSMPAPDGYRAGIPFINAKTKKAIKNGGYDIIHAHSPFTIGKYAIKLAKKLGIPSLLTVHTKYKSDFERVLRSKTLQKFMLSYIMRVVNKADYVLSVSNGAGEVVKEYGYKGDVHIIRNGTDMVPKDIDKKLIKDVEEKYDLKDNFVFLSVGRIVANKNIQFSLEVLKKVKESGVNNFKFLIVGAGDYTNTLKELTKKYNLEENVVFTGKIMDRDYLSAVYNRADLFMFPSDFDTCGIVAIEAAANNLPSMMLENTCASEVIENGKNGFALANDVNVWKEKIIEILANKDILKNIKKKARETIYVHWTDIVMEYYDFYKKVLEEFSKKKGEEK